MPAKSKAAKPQKNTGKAAKPAAVKPKAAAKPAAKPAVKKAPAKPATKAKVVAKAKPVAKPKAAAKPVAKPVVKKAPAKPATKAKVVAKAKPVAKPKAAAKPVAKPVIKAQPAAKPVAKAAPTKTVPSPKGSSSKPVSSSTSSSNSKKTVPVKAAPVSPAKKTKTANAAALEFIPYQEKIGEDYMNDEQKAHFRQLLLAWKTDLMQEVDRTVTHMKDGAANFPDPADRATQEEEFSLELRARDRERKLIKKIDSTIELIEQDQYGYCEQCGIEIGVRRLEARPTATLCIDCKTLSEIKEKQTGV